LGFQIERLDAKKGELPNQSKNREVIMAKRIAGWLLTGLFFLIPLYPETGSASIGNIKKFLDTCPKNDPVYNQIKKDFTIRHNGVVVPLDGIACSEPISSLPIAQYTDELIILLGIRI
jgi:hypothetical protein